MQVTLRCGHAEKLAKLAEPSRCEYTAELATPAACTPGEGPASPLRTPLTPSRLEFSKGCQPAAQGPDVENFLGVEQAGLQSVTRTDSDTLSPSVCRVSVNAPALSCVSCCPAEDLAALEGELRARERLLSGEFDEEEAIAAGGALRCAMLRCAVLCCAALCRGALYFNVCTL